MLKASRLMMLVVFAIFVMLTWIGEAPAATPINSCQILSVSGTYQLTDNIGLSTSPCLSVAADSVTIDLNGFVMTGELHPGFHAISDTSAAHKGTIVRNGIIHSS